MDRKMLQQAGGVKQGENNPTWLKQPGDMGSAMIGVGLLTFGFLQYGVGLYNISNNKGKED